MSAAQPLDYADRCERYARQRGWAYDPKRLSIGHLTPRQRRRAIKKERSAWPLYSRRSIDMPWDDRYRAYDDEVAEAEQFFLGGNVAAECDVCGLPDPYQGTGDGIGSCDCPRCDGGEAAASSVLCACPPDWDPDGDERDFDEEIRAELQARYDAGAAEAERRFLGDLDGWKPTGLMPPGTAPTATEQET